jgi:Predicted kinase
MCGPAGCGKSSFAMKNFGLTQIVSSDRCRAIISDDESNMEVSKDAFELFYYIIGKRMGAGNAVVADSTALSYDARRRLLQLARENGYYTLLLVFNIPLSRILSQNSMRERNVSRKVIERQYEAFKKSLQYLDKEGYDSIFTIDESNIDDVKIKIQSSNMEVADSGPFDIISDIHGCCSELVMLLEKLGYKKSNGIYRHLEGRKIIFAGDIVDRGPRILDTVNLVLEMVHGGSAYYTPGNHCNKFFRYLTGRRVQIKHGLEMTVDEYENLEGQEKQRFKEKFKSLYESAPPYLILDDGRLVVAHAGIKEDMIGKYSKEILDFVLYGDVTGEVDIEGFPVRGDWASNYCGMALIVYGHTPVLEPLFINNTINIDQGVSIGGSLTALRYPEREIVQVKALNVYYTEGRRREKIKHHLDLNEYIKPIVLEDRYGIKHRFSSEETGKAVEFLKSQPFDKSWVVYVPPILPSASTSDFRTQIHDSVKYYKGRGMKKIIVEEMQGYYTAVAVICKDMAASKSYFSGDKIGEIYCLYEKLPVDERDKDNIIQELYKSLRESEYFVRHNTDYVIIECYFKKTGEVYNIVPVKILSHSCSSFFNKDNLWQVENIDRFCSCSAVIQKNMTYIVENADETENILKQFSDAGVSFASVKPVKPYPEYKGVMMQPELLCSPKPICTGQESMALSTLGYYFSIKNMEKFIKNKLSKDYFKYIIGCIGINNRILKMRM